MITKFKNGGGRWLIVDDSPDILALMRDMLEYTVGIKAETFKDGSVALEAIQAAPDTIELVLTDLKMPRMNGFELCHQVRQIAPTAAVVLVTSSGYLDERGAIDFGFDGLVRKPFSVGELIAVLANARERVTNNLKNAVTA